MNSSYLSYVFVIEFVLFIVDNESAASVCCHVSFIF